MRLLSDADLENLDYAYNVIRTLRTSSIAAIVERLRPFLHIDPIAVLPPEITSEIFSYLSPSMLLEASKASRAWRERTLDSRLWKQKFAAEGWGLDMKEVSRFERSYKYPAVPRKTRSRRAETHAEQRKQKRRARNATEIGLANTAPRALQHQSAWQHESQAWNDQEGPVEVDVEDDTIMKDSTQDEDMHDVGSLSSGLPTNGGPPALVHMETMSSQQSNDAASPSPLSTHSHSSTFVDSSAIRRNSSTKEPPLVHASFSGFPRLNFHQVYKQKRKLEENWMAGRYKSFQLPHRDFPGEAHSECVYTIQYSGKYLVSGSRDRTLRIWDLETQRLIRKPLKGHTGSVLCLQFDDSEEEDIIVSGSSDTDVILWRFSTGRMIQKLPRAHKESVLNLKFDERFLVTCSKDKTIKIWNRHELRPGDKDYPIRNVPGGGKCPAYIIDLSSYTTPFEREHSLSAKQKEPLPKYSLIMTLDSHGAAVNAIHIHNDQLVSASGDRTLKVFDIHTGVSTITCQGHTKGIACVQYDGTRIVSGSSDNTIRIFDPATRAEVACLQGHAHLVRTIQAAFCDIPGTREELEEEALAIDRKYFEARRSGAIPESSMASRRNRARNAGSKNPENIMATGAKIPPGGGGSRWGRIVSGSYDETIIIWKKTPDGSWVVGHKLRQVEALRAAGGPLLAHSEVQRARSGQYAINHPQHAHGHGQLVVPPHPHVQSVAQTIAHPPHAMQQIPFQVSAQQVIQQAMQTGVVNLQTGMQNLAAINNHLINNPQAHPMLANLTNPPVQYPVHLQTHAQQQQPQPQHQHQHQQAHHQAQISQPNARVFKLQFDARRIICCSQDPKIVGWDFANGDAEIIECSRFFGVPT